MVASPVTPPTPGNAARRPGDRRTDLRQLARGSSASLAGSVVAASLNLILPVVITRSLAREDAGLLFQAMALFTIVLNVGTVGADTGLLRALPRAIALGRHRDLGRLLAVAMVPAVVAGALVAVLVVAGAGPLAGLVGQDAAQAEEFQLLLVALAPWIPVAVLYALAMSASRGLGSVRPLVLVEKIGRNALETGATALALSLSASLALVITAWVAPYAAMLVVVGWWLLPRLRRARARAGDTPPGEWTVLARDFWAFSLPRALSRVFTVALQRVDILIVGALSGPVDAAVYAAATRFLVLGLVLVQSLQQVMAPRISEFLATGEDDRAEAIYRTTTAWLTLVSWPVYLGVIWFAPLLMSIFGPGFAAGAPAVVVLCAAMLVAASCGPVDSVLLMSGRSRLSLLNTSLALTTCVALDLLLVPAHGVTGAAVAWAVAILVNNLLPLWQVNRHVRLHPLGRATLTAMGISLVSAGVVGGAVRLTMGSDLADAVLASILALTAYVVLVRRHRTVLQVDALLAVLPGRRGRRGGRARGSRSTQER